MSVNNYKPHLLILPEDRANQEMIDGFLQEPTLRYTKIQDMPIVGGWRKVIDKFKKEYISGLQKFTERRILLLIDFDGDGDRLAQVQAEIPQQFVDRVFVLGVWTEPEDLRKATSQSFESIGEILANECATQNYQLWQHDLLKHNDPELQRLINDVRPLLFP